MAANRLIHEKSPYLLQHAHNPVDWHAWNDETFAKALAGNKPIFLSIGYATCHWCHVMERESFEDEEAARHLNETFVCIKVDREERPEVAPGGANACPGRSAGARRRGDTRGSCPPTSCVAPIPPPGPGR